MKSRVLAVDSPEWNQTLGVNPHDFYHLSLYHQLSAAREGGLAYAFVAEEGENRAFIPFILRPVPCLGLTEGGFSDITSAYGYPGPLFWPYARVGADFIHRAVGALIRELNERRVVSAFFRLHPLLDREREHLLAFGPIVDHGETVVINLGKSEEELWQDTREGCRYDIKRLRKQGYVVEEVAFADGLDAFFGAYEDTMRRVDATAGYFFDRAYFTLLKEALGDRLHLFLVRLGDDVCGGALFTECNGIVQYHLSGMYTKFARSSPTKLLLDEVRRWARKRDNCLFHLGGGVGTRRDSLFEFKAGFSKGRASFGTWRVILDPMLYEQLEKAAHPKDAILRADTDYFPSYRRPTPSAPAK
jgi:hypothetical protein